MPKSQLPARHPPAEPEPQVPAKRDEPFPALLIKSRAELAKLIHEPAMVERFMRVALTEFRKNASLKSCSPESIMASVLEAARLNLEIGGSLRQGYLVPYDGACTFQPSYIGLLELARRSGEFRDIDAILVNANDVFSYERDREPGDPLQVARPRLYHRPNLWDPGPTLGTYVYAILANGEPKFLAMSRAEIETVRHKSRAPGSLMWKEFWGEGAKKTVLKRFLKMQRQTPELARAIELDNAEYDLDAPGTATARVRPGRGLAGLRGQLGLDEPALPPQPTKTYSEADEPTNDDPGDAPDRPGADEAPDDVVPADDVDWPAGRQSDPRER
jgi:recombination protein RecT